MLKLSGDSKDIKEKVRRRAQGKSFRRGVADATSRVQVANATRIVEADILEGSKLRAFLKN